MSIEKPHIISVAGFDPCGGAGVLADIKTIEQHQCQGMAVITSVTGQNEDQFSSINWLTWEEIKNQLLPLIERYEFQAVKIGLIESVETILSVTNLFASFNQTPIVIWDPVLSATAGYTFHEQPKSFAQALQNIDLVTPNLGEVQKLSGEDDIEEFIESNLQNTSFLVKGGHATDHADDILYTDNKSHTIAGERISGADKHGTGCVLSSAIACNLARGNDMLNSCTKAKAYLTKRLIANGSKLLIHND